LVAPVLALLWVGDARFRALTFLIAAIFAVLVASGRLGSWDLPSALPISLHYFLIGMMTNWLMIKFSLRRAILVAVLVALSMWQTIKWSDAYSVVAAAVALGIWAFAIAVIITETDPARGQGLFWRWIKQCAFGEIASRIGSVSYSTYLLHIPIFVVGLKIFITAFHLQRSPTTYAFAMVLLTPIVLGVSWLAYRFVEKPGIRFGATVSSFLDRKAPDKRFA